jgi:hypothetical protein
MATPGKVTYRIGKLQGGLLITLCAIADLVQVLLSLTGVLAIISIIITAIVEGIVTVTFWWEKVPYTGGKKALSKFLTFFGMSVIEFVPFLDDLPTLTIGTAMMIRASWAEDRATFAANQEAQKKSSPNRKDWTKMESYRTGNAGGREAEVSAEQEYA